MALPSNWTRVTVQGQFLNLDGTPMTGQVTFTPTARVLLDATAGTVIAGTTWSVTLDGTGFFTVQLPATDDPDINPTGLTDVDDVASFSYTVSEPTGRRYTLTVPSTAGTIDLVTVGSTGSPSATAPGAPTIGTATGGNGQATVTFAPPSNNGGATITSYTATSTPGGITASGSSSPITVTGLANGTAYTFKVKATNSAGTGAESAASNSVTPAGSGATVPGAPTIGTATAGSAGSGAASVAFTAPGSDGGATITSYTATSTPGGLTASGSSSPITIAGLTFGTAYTFKVKATNSVGTGAESGASNSVTPAAGGGGGGTGPVLEEWLQVSGNNAAALTTDTFTPLAGEVLVVKAGTWASTVAPGTPSGGGLTWTQRIVENGGGFNGRVEIWTAPVVTSPGPIAITLSAPATSCHHALFVERWSNAQLATSPVTASGFTNGATAPIVSITTSEVNSAVSFVCYDNNSADPASRTYVPPGQEVGIVSTVSSGIFYSGRALIADAGPADFGLSTPSAMRWDMAGIELLSVSTGGGGGGGGGGGLGVARPTEQVVGPPPSLRLTYRAVAATQTTRSPVFT